MENCIFCKIAKHEIPTYCVYEDEQIIAFLDLNPVQVGHTLVVPKKHSEDICSIDEQTLAYAMKISKKIAISMLANLPGCKGINIINNCKPAAGQAILHTHIHLIPRYDNGEEFLNMKNYPGQLTKKQMETLAKQIAI